MAEKFKPSTEFPNVYQLIHATASGVLYDHLRLAGSTANTVNTFSGASHTADRGELAAWKIAGKPVLTES